MQCRPCWAQVPLQREQPELRELRQRQVRQQPVRLQQAWQRQPVSLVRLVRLV